MSFHVHEGDALEVLRTLPSNSYHGSLSDPPYGLSFMGHTWDHGVPSAEVWAEVLRCLKPGAHLLAFGGTRTFHRLTCAIEDAGFEIRDCMMWLYGSGFPKSHDVSKAIDREAGAVREVVGTNDDYLRRKPNGMKTDGATAYGYSQSQQETNADITAPATEAARQWSGHGTALKPAWEPIILARKPLEGTVAQNVQVHGCGGLAIDASRVEVIGKKSEGGRTSGGVTSTSDTRAIGAGIKSGSNDDGLGRWPANVILDEDAGAILDAQSGNRPGMSGGGKHKPGSTGGMFGAIDCEHTARGDNGGASRFFMSCGPSRDEAAFSRAMTMLSACNFDHASIANAHSVQRRYLADSALNDAVTLVSQGAIQLLGWTGLSTVATLSESKTLSATLIATILTFGEGSSQEPQRVRNFPTGSRASLVPPQRQTDTTTITISHWRSDGSAEPVTFSITPLNSAHGEAASSRFIYCPKASRSERDAGLEAFDAGQSLYSRGTGLKANGDGSERSETRNVHPTVKPLALNRYLARLILPPIHDARMLTPFCGSGSEMIGALQAGWAHVDGIDSWDVAARIAKARLAHWTK
jgi:site-specific DNA-methyltransferase (adenine-specific)